MYIKSEKRRLSLSGSFPHIVGWQLRLRGKWLNWECHKKQCAAQVNPGTFSPQGLEQIDIYEVHRVHRCTQEAKRPMQGTGFIPPK
jgi:hypothetical protein